jgi:hypothetical protein
MSIAGLHGLTYNQRQAILNDPRRTTKVVSTTVATTVADTYNPTEWDLSSEFTQYEFDKGVIPLQAEVDHGSPVASAANTYAYYHAQLTKSAQTSMKGRFDSDVLYEKFLMYGSGAAAGCINFVAAKEYELFLIRNHIIDRDTKKLHWGMITSSKGATQSSKALVEFSYIPSQ